MNKRIKLFSTALLLSSCTIFSTITSFANDNIRINPDTVQKIKYVPSNDMYLSDGTLFSNDLKMLVVRPDEIFTGIPSDGCTVRELLNSISCYKIDFSELHTGEGVFVSIAGLNIAFAFDDQFTWWCELTENHIPTDEDMNAFYERINNLKFYPSGGPNGELIVIKSTATHHTSNEEEDFIIDQAAEYFRSFNDMSSSTVTASWKQDTNGWWYDNGNGTWPANTWKWIDSNGDGISECYYFDANGYRLCNTTTPDGYQVDANGAWVENGIVRTQ